MDDIEFAFKFPFSKTGKAIARDYSKKKNPLSPDILSKAKERIEEAMRGKHTKQNFIDEIDAKDTILSFYVAKTILACNFNPFVINKFAIHESKIAFEGNDEKDNVNVIERLAEEMDITFSKSTTHYKIHVVDFLKYAPDDPYYSKDLFYINLKKGYVETDAQRFKRIVEGAIAKTIKQSIVRKENCPNEIIEAYKTIEAVMPKRKSVKIHVKKHPPCIERILSDLMKHKNLPHYARWALAVYLVNIGVDKEKIIQLFSNSPDFSEKITRYQVEHIIKKGYSMPSCDKMLSYGLCVSKCGVKNPLDLVKGKKHERSSKNVD